jgi:hypothetical protein
VPLGDIVSGDSLARKRALKRLHARLPARWLFKFFYLYVWKSGFLDGYPGFAYCTLNGFYDFLICVKVRERKTGTKGLRDEGTKRLRDEGTNGLKDKGTEGLKDKGTRT